MLSARTAWDLAANRLAARLEANRAALAGRAGTAFDLLRSAGGWSAVLRIGETVDEEALCLSLLEEGVAVQPEFFFDFEPSGYLVVSLLPPPETFTQGIEVLARRLEG